MSELNWYKILNKYSDENLAKSWFAVLISFVLVIAFVSLVLVSDFWILKLLYSFFIGLSLLRVFSLYHEYNHGAILESSKIAKPLMSFFGFVMMSPMPLWDYYHNLHHRENSKFSLKVMGDFATITKTEFEALKPAGKRRYLLRRNQWVILFGYFTVFIISFCLNPFRDDPKKNYLGLLSVFFHIGLYVGLGFTIGIVNTIFVVLIPMFTFGFLGSLIFYLQHNCKGLTFFKKENWNQVKAAVYSSSFIQMNSFWRFFTANVGFHNLHHLNAKIPFYNLPKAMKELETENVTVVRFNVSSVIQSLRLKLYDENKGELVEL